MTRAELIEEIGWGLGDLAFIALVVLFSPVLVAWKIYECLKR